jgi:PKD repeat protein
MKPLKTWVTAGGHTKIVGVLPSMLPVWTGPAKRASDSYVLGWSPLKTRDITAAAALVSAGTGSNLGIRINGAADYPMFQGFQLADPLLFESKAKHDLLAAELLTSGQGFATHATAAAPRMNLFPLFFDVSHGITPTTNTLGAAAAGGCAMCHSSSAINPMTGQPMDPATYSPYSVGFFDSSKDMLKNGMMQMADYDCGEVGNTGMNMMMCGMFDAMGSTPGTCEAAEFAACKSYIGSNLYPQFGLPGDIATAMPVDGIDMMQLFAIQEGATAMGCDTRYSFFGFPTAGRMTGPGSMTNGTGPTNGCIAADFFSRDQIRQYFKKNLEQSSIASTMTGTWTNPVSGVVEAVPASVRRVFSIVSRAKNPGNSADTMAKFDMGATCIINPMTGETGACPTDGSAGYMNTRVSESQLLGYTADHLAGLMVHREINSTPTSSMPAARFSYTVSGLSVAFTNQSVNATGISWNFGDGVTSTVTPTVTHLYSAGTHTMTLTATNAVGSNVKTMTFTLAAVSTAPTASFTVDSIIGNTVTITDTSVAGTGATSVFVNWGDGRGENLASAGSQVSHTYANGTYTIILGARNLQGGLTTAKSAALRVPNGTGSVSGLVRTSTNAPLQAYVTLSSAGTNTVGVYSLATDGSYTVTQLTAGTYTVKASMYGYVIPDQTVVVGAGAAVANLTALAPAVLSSISGFVDNAPAGLLVVCHPANSTVVLGAQFTDLNGAFSFTNLTTGLYDIETRPTGTSTVTPALTLQDLLVTGGTGTIISHGTWTYIP